MPSPRSLQIGNLSIPMPAVQAALSGYSDAPMRLVARAHGAPYTLHEVVLDRLVLQQGKHRRRMFDLAEGDHPVGGQLMGSEPETFGAAARELVDAGFDVVDINFGCPVKKVLGRCRGGYLLTEPDTALEIVQRVLDAVQGDVPVSVKMRRGHDDSEESRARFFTILEGAFECGVAAITVHPRTVVQRYDGPSRWAFLREVKARAGEHTILGSGDLFTARHVIQMLEETGVDGVTVARGAIGNPFVFRQVAQLLAGEEAMAPSMAEVRQAIFDHGEAAVRLYGEERAVSKTRLHAIQYAHRHHPDPAAARTALLAARNPPALVAALAEWFDPERFPLAAEPLRGEREKAVVLAGGGVG